MPRDYFHAHKCAKCKAEHTCTSKKCKDDFTTPDCPLCAVFVRWVLSGRQWQVRDIHISIVASMVKNGEKVQRVLTMPRAEQFDIVHDLEVSGYTIDKIEELP